MSALTMAAGLRMSLNHYPTLGALTEEASLEATRMVLGLLTAVLLPYGVPFVAGKRISAAIVSAAFGVYVTSSLIPSWKAWVLLAILAAWIASFAYLSAKPKRVMASQQAAAASSPATSKPKTHRLSRASLSVIVAAAVSLLAVSVLVNAHATWHALHELVFNDRIVIVLSGFLIAVFVGHLPTVHISASYSGHSITWEDGLPTVENVGVIIGWFERALIFGFVVSGQIGGAALALTAKSLARYPALERKEISGEYFLVGTFISVLFAILSAIATRISLNLAPI
jgi:hypothetical protein